MRGGNGTSDFTGQVAQAAIHTMAGGGAPPAYKYYFVAQDAPSKALFLVEMVVATEARSAAITVKSDAPAPLLREFLDLWRAVLLAFYR